MVSQSHNMFAKHVVSRFKIGIQFIIAVVSGTVQHIIQIDAMRSTKCIVQITPHYRKRTIVMAYGTPSPRDLIA